MSTHPCELRSWYHTQRSNSIPRQSFEFIVDSAGARNPAQRIVAQRSARSPLVRCKPGALLFPILPLFLGLVYCQNALFCEIAITTTPKQIHGRMDQEYGTDAYPRPRVARIIDSLERAAGSFARSPAATNCFVLTTANLLLRYAPPYRYIIALPQHRTKSPRVPPAAPPKAFHLRLNFSSEYRCSPLVWVPRYEHILITDDL